MLIDDEFTQITELLKPGRRARHDARARIRTLLAMEAHVGAAAQVSAKDVDRVERGIKAGRARTEVFPRLSDVSAQIDGTGATITVRFSKTEGAPVRYVADETVPAAAIREVDLDRKFYLSATDVAKRVGLSTSRATALRRHLGIDGNPRAHYVFVLDSQRIAHYSDAAVESMQTAVATLDMRQVWDGHKPRGRSQTPRVCSVEGCAGGPCAAA